MPPLAKHGVVGVPTSSAIHNYSDVNQGHMCCQRCFVLQVEQCYGECASNQGDQCQITGVYMDQEPMLPEPNVSMSELFLIE